MWGCVVKITYSGSPFNAVFQNIIIIKKDLENTLYPLKIDWLRNNKSCILFDQVQSSITKQLVFSV